MFDKLYIATGVATGLEEPGHALKAPPHVLNEALTKVLSDSVSFFISPCHLIYAGGGGGLERVQGREPLQPGHCHCEQPLAEVSFLPPQYHSFIFFKLENMSQKCVTHFGAYHRNPEGHFFLCRRYVITEDKNGKKTYTKKSNVLF